MDDDPSEDDVSLSALQLSLMQVLWARGEASTAEVVDALRDAASDDASERRPLAHTTVATLLTRLERRGLLASRREGRALVFRPLVTQSHVQRSMAGRLVDRLFAGRPSALLSHLLDARQVDSRELAELRALLAAHPQPETRDD